MAGFISNKNLKEASSGGYLDFSIGILCHLENALCLKDVGSLLLK